MNSGTRTGESDDPASLARIAAARRPGHPLLPATSRTQLQMLTACLTVVALAVAVSFILPRTYQAEMQMLVTPAALIPDPAAPAPSIGAQPAGQAARMKLETELARSPIVAQRVLMDVGPARVYPHVGLPGPLAGKTDDASGDARLAAFIRDLQVHAARGSSVITISATAREPHIAIETLWAFAAEYQRYRVEVLAFETEPGLVEERERLQARLADAEETYRQFLDGAGVRDFYNELAAAEQQTAQRAAAHADALAAQSAEKARVKGLRRQLSQVSTQVDRTIDPKPTTEVPAHLRKRLGPLDSDEAELTPAGLTVPGSVEPARPMATLPEGGALRRLGSNPMQQQLTAGLAFAGASADAEAGRASELERQSGAIAERASFLASLQPEHDRLQRDIQVVRDDLNRLARREEDARSRAHLALSAHGRVTVYQEPYAKGAAMGPRVLTILGGILAGALAALIIGLLRRRSPGPLRPAQDA